MKDITTSIDVVIIGITITNNNVLVVTTFVAL